MPPAGDERVDEDEALVDYHLHASGVHVQLTDLTLTNFRSYRQLDLALEPGLTVVSG